MSVPSVKIKRLFSGAILPTRSFPTDSGLDLYAYRFEKVYHAKECYDTTLDTQKLILQPGDRAAIHTGISATVGVGFEIQVRPRSGLALKQGLSVLNTPGTIDEQYRGPITVIMINASTISQEVQLGTRIAQMVVCPVVLSEVEEVTDLPATERAAGGFGHTGK